MKKSLQCLLLFISTIFLLTNCSKKEWDDYYGRPSDLGPPIYQQLEERGNFKHLTALLDRTGYKDIISGSGWWTMFAPTDAAFEEFFKQQNIAGVSDLSDSLARSIVRYSLVYNSYRKDQLSINQSATEGLQNAFKRRTSYYDWVKNGTDGVHKKIIGANRNNSVQRASSTSSVIVNVFNYVNGDNNYKYIPYFTDEYVATGIFSSSDYKAFYPESNFTGFNVANAAVTEADIAAENGMIHIVDKVILPLQNLDQYLSSHAEYSDFKKILDSLGYYSANPYLTQRNFVVTGESDSVYVKSYNGQLAFAVNNENYMSPGSSSFSATASQGNSWTLLAPTNDALKEYRKKLLAKYNNSFFGSAPSSLVIDFVNSHMWSTSIWPNQLATSPNYQEELPTIGTGDILNKQILSNGILYGIKSAHQANAFRTLYGVPYLDPAYYMSLMAYNTLTTGIRTAITQPTTKHAIFLIPDALLTNAGWRYNESSASGSNTAWGYKSASATSYSHSATFRETILRMITSGVLRNFEGDLDNLAGEGIAETLNGEYIKYNNNKIQTSGMADNETWANIISTNRSAINGPAYTVDALLTFSEQNVGQHIEKLAEKYPETYGSYFWFLKSSNVYNATTKKITGVNTGVDDSYTILIPSNAAIQEAIKNGLLPGTVSTGALPTTAPTSEAHKDLVRKFIQYHIINGATVVTDGKKSDNYLTLMQTESGDNTLMEVLSIKNGMVLTDRTGRQANVILNRSNQLSNRAVIHAIDNYLKYSN